ncbi:MAG TPA: hypothetical protein PKY30_10815, partial [Myxococcota bacterium]|nr:hypothetical protein [Myxococcota bacterium]
FNGYQVAGVRGAVTGAAAGAAAGFGATLAGGLLVGLLGLPLTLPVLLPVLAVAGLASSFGARWFTHAVFGGEQVERFREGFRKAVLERLEASASIRVEELERGTDRQVAEVFGALRKQVEQELGGVIEQTQRTLNDLHTSTTRSAAQREQELADLERAAIQAHDLQQQMAALSIEVRSLQGA